MEDIRILIQRHWQEDKTQTLGTIYILNENRGIVLEGYSLELADKGNKRQKSRIPSGVYKVKLRWSPKYGNHFHILDVEGRTWILIHIGNYYRDTIGCILVGYDYGDIDGDGLNDVTNSGKFLKEMLEILPEEFHLQIEDDNVVEI